MKINVIGGGPAGLYFAILMKKANASHRIKIHERNGPDDTFCWGVVFSGKTLANLRAADEESHGEITKQFAQGLRTVQAMTIGKPLYLLEALLPTERESVRHSHITQM